MFSITKAAWFPYNQAANSLAAPREKLEISGTLRLFIKALIKLSILSNAICIGNGERRSVFWLEQFLF